MLKVLLFTLFNNGIYDSIKIKLYRFDKRTLHPADPVGGLEGLLHRIYKENQAPRPPTKMHTATYITGVRIHLSVTGQSLKPSPTNPQPQLTTCLPFNESGNIINLRKYWLHEVLTHFVLGENCTSYLITVSAGYHMQNLL